MSDPLVLNLVDVLTEAGYPSMAEDIKEAAERLRAEAIELEVGGY